MASFGKVLDLLDDRYLQLQDVIGNVEPLPTLVPYEQYTQNVIAYRMDTDHEIFLGLIQDFTMRRALETRKETWTYLVQWEVDSSAPMHHPSSPKKARLNLQPAQTLFKGPSRLQQAPALTIFERRTLDGALMLEEDMLRILIDIVQVASSLVPNFIEFLYRWIDYYEGDGKALKAALRWEIPSLWDFEYHPLVLPKVERKEGHVDKQKRQGNKVLMCYADELRQSSPTKTLRAKHKPDLADMELRTFNTEESERLQYREVKFGIQPPELEQPLPPLINIPRDQRKRTKYYAACFKSRQRALCLLLEAGVTMRQINNYQKLQHVHPKETTEGGDANGLRNYNKDATFAQTHFELKEEQSKQREIAISNKLAVEAQLAASHTIPDGAAGLPLIPPTPSNFRKTDMAAAMMSRIRETKAHAHREIKIVPGPLVGKMKSRVFANAKQEVLTDLLWQKYGIPNMVVSGPTTSEDESIYSTGINEGKPELDYDTDNEDLSSDIEGHTSGEAVSVVSSAATSLPRPLLPRPLLPSPPTIPLAANPNNLAHTSSQPPYYSPLVSAALDTSTPPNIATYMQNLSTEQAQRIVSLLSSQARQVAASTLQGGALSQNALQQSSNSSVVESTAQLASVGDAPLLPFNGASSRGVQPTTLHSLPSGGDYSVNQDFVTAPTATHSATDTIQSQPPFPIPFDPNFFVYLIRQQEASQSAATYPNQTEATLPVESHAHSVHTGTDTDMYHRPPAQQQRILPAGFAALNAHTRTTDFTSFTANQTDLRPHQQPLAEPYRSSEDQLELDEFRPAGGSSLLPLHVPIPQLRPTLQAQPPSFNPVPAIQITPSNHPPPPLLLPSTSRLNIARNAPAPLSLPLQSPSPFTSFNTQVMATSPFATTPVTDLRPIQIYLPRVVISGNNTILNETMDTNSTGSTETDALLLGHEDTITGALVFGKAVFLPCGVWENTIRKVRSGRWSVLETYACPSSHPAFGKGKGKEVLGEKGCHRAIYDKLAQAYGMIIADPMAREEDLTKRWRVSRGPMTSWDRGAVWEGWGVVVDRAVNLSQIERQGALRSEVKGSEGVDCGWSSDGDEVVRRQNEMDELMDESELGDE